MRLPPNSTTEPHETNAQQENSSHTVKAEELRTKSSKQKLRTRLENREKIEEKLGSNKWYEHSPKKDAVTAPAGEVQGHREEQASTVVPSHASEQGSLSKWVHKDGWGRAGCIRLSLLVVKTRMLTMTTAHFYCTPNSARHNVRPSTHIISFNPYAGPVRHSPHFIDEETEAHRSSSHLPEVPHRITA